jgi:hypothetical protein
LGRHVCQIGSADSEIVLVQDYLEVVRQTIFHGPIEGPEPGGAQLIARVHMLERLQVDAYGPESAVVNQLKMALMEARLGGVIPQRIVAENIDAPAHYSYLLERIERRECLRLRAHSAHNQGGQRHQPERFIHSVLHGAVSEAR